MLMLLHIENIAVIEKADITFQNGFNALTGETGAGKSIIIDALGAVLGQRISRDLVRTGAERACVSAMFSDMDEILPILTETGCFCCSATSRRTENLSAGSMAGPALLRSCARWV